MQTEPIIEITKEQKDKAGSKANLEKKVRGYFHVLTRDSRRIHLLSLVLT